MPDATAEDSSIHRYIVVIEPTLSARILSRSGGGSGNVWWRTWNLRRRTRKVVREKEKAPLGTDCWSMAALRVAIFNHI